MRECMRQKGKYGKDGLCHCGVVRISVPNSILSSLRVYITQGYMVMDARNKLECCLHEHMSLKISKWLAKSVEG
ncbi:hypothetical protein QVD17_01267 [Tagetes erecta]|uniref:Uncharacterized protein n=1 Tax=Tagetes erecta TaxID=13708 RepID=A0AAD8L635_TARER|nr:hypothetical protein QVD17_01267 [Tagetes erecta]